MSETIAHILSTIMFYEGFILFFLILGMYISMEFFNEKVEKFLERTIPLFAVLASIGLDFVMPYAGLYTIIYNAIILSLLARGISVKLKFKENKQ